MSIYEKYPSLMDLLASSDMGEGEYAYDFKSCWTVQNPSGPYEEMDVAAALIVSMGNMSAAARLLNRPRRLLSTYVVRNVLLSDLLEDLNDEFVDAVEQRYKGLALVGDGTALKFFLTTLGKDRGYVTRSESTGPNGGPMQTQSTISVSALKEVSEEALEELLRARDDAAKKAMAERAERTE